MENDYMYRLLCGPETSPKRLTLADLLKPLDPTPALLPSPPSPTALGTLSDLLGKPPDLRLVPFGKPSALPIAFPTVRLSDLVPLPQAPTAVPTGIRFGGCSFCEPFLFIDSQSLPSEAGLYVALAYDERCNPRPYRPLYFGKAAKLSERVSFSHEKWNEWLRAADSSPIYIAYCAMPWSTDNQRRAIEESLIREYAPKCNDVHNPFGGGRV